jgi:hypothetical protein
MPKANVNQITAATFAGPFRFLDVEAKYQFSADRSAPKVQETSKLNGLPVWKVTVFSPAGLIVVSVPHPSQPLFDDMDHLEFENLAAGAFSGNFYWRADSVRDVNI